MIESKRGIFGLDSVKVFFSVLVGLAILIFVIIVVLGTLTDSGVGGRDWTYGQMNNESVAFWLNATNGGSVTTVGTYTAIQFNDNTVINESGAVIPTSNYTVSGGTFSAVDGSPFEGGNISISGEYQYGELRSTELAQNVTTGSTSFISGLTSVFGILAIVVIILVLFVLVRIVGGDKGNGVI